jgi:FKBP-type peptidyl-prolyl cis-trans isomerase
MLNGKGDTLLSTYRTKEVVNQEIVPSPYPGSLMEGLMLLGQGDSASFMLDTRKIAKAGYPLPEGIQPGDELRYVLKVVGHRNGQELKAENQKDMITQFMTDENIVRRFMDTTKLGKFERHRNGMRYQIARAGSGKLPQDGDSIYVNFVGYKFDNKLQPFDMSYGKAQGFVLRPNQLIPAWEFMLRTYGREGAAFNFTTPSYMAFGKAAKTFYPSGIRVDIEPNSPLRFVMQVVKIVPAPKR